VPPICSSQLLAPTPRPTHSQSHTHAARGRTCTAYGCGRMWPKTFLSEPTPPAWSGLHLPNTVHTHTHTHTHGRANDAPAHTHNIRTPPTIHTHTHTHTYIQTPTSHTTPPYPFIITPHPLSLAPRCARSSYPSRSARHGPSWTAAWTRRWGHYALSLRRQCSSMRAPWPRRR
jgi:hypothetical protein